MCLARPRNKGTQQNVPLPPRTRSIPAEVAGFTIELFASRIRAGDLTSFLDKEFGKGTWAVHLQDDRYIVVAPRELTAVSWLRVREGLTLPACA